MRPHIAALLCYIPTVGWLASIFFLTAENYRNHRYVHFHALQGLFLFVAYFMVRAFFGFTPNILVDPMMVPFGHWSFIRVLKLAVIIIQVVGMVKTAKGEDYRLPVLGDLAERSITP